MNYGFQATDDDVATVLRREWARVTNTNGVPFEVMAEQLLLDLNADAIERAALQHSTELEEQTDATLDEIERQLVAKGVLRARQDQST